MKKRKTDYNLFFSVQKFFPPEMSLKMHLQKMIKKQKKFTFFVARFANYIYLSCYFIQLLLSLILLFVFHIPPKKKNL